MLSSRPALPLRTCLQGALGHALLLSAALACLRPAAAIELRFDYTYDTAGFFGANGAPSPAREALEFAGRAFTPFTDWLAPIQPSGGNSWIGIVRHPGTGGQLSLPNLVVDGGVITIFAGARNLADSTLAEAGRGVYSFPLQSSPSEAFRANLVNRGQGDASDDFAPWGGYIGFDTSGPGGGTRKWHFDFRTAPSNDAFDFYTVAVHELAHLLGFGTSTPFVMQLESGRFAGSKASEIYGGPVPLYADNQHWGLTVTSPPQDAPQKPSLAPQITFGERRLFTPLDYAAMADIGWEATPEQLGFSGDVNGDLFVDGADFLAWQRNLGGFGGSPGDVDGSRQVDQYDGWLVLQALGADRSATARAGAGGGAVPEPSAVKLLSFAVLMLAGRRLKAS